MSVLEEIEEWKLEAKLEDNERYFYHTRTVDRIVNGKKLYIIGRKGTGKTAITENLITKKEACTFSQKLTFKNFPFNKFYELEDKGFTSPNQYITLWKYLIYSTTCKLLIENNSVAGDVRDKLKNLFNDDISSALPAAVERWTGFKFDVKILEIGFGIGGNKKHITVENSNWIERVDVLEKFLIQNLGDSKYLIIFDELDEDYKDIAEPEKHIRYTQLLTGLFKAAQDVRSKFSKWAYYPVIFLRDDIYEILQDPDKTKWTDYRIDLDWERISIQNMLAFRISRAIDPNGSILTFNQAWMKIMESGDVKYGHQKRSGMPIFDYITRSSFLRPRDYIRYLQICAEKANNKHLNRITPAIVADADTAFSNHLRSELEDEIHGVIPDIHKILNLFTILRKQTIRIEEFKQQFELAVAEGKITSNDYQRVLETLFHFSVIGNQPKQQTHQVFRYKNKDARLNMKENIIVHRGLYRSLQIL
ncbi:conserved hypothetical protein [Candidatus Nitrotoga sp. BS]|uniref:P-loop ATPase, Sll1717 family n=1 Tax=Candidatus Nitrotoga sp. BS TaxID=2890408 RepID=UPI001EF1BAF3|nr:hypothetical protein [Candidatus Nitrotoga sp. BS]CAH1201949.1 conserved hypothetical protein [Candidatus Nitrotoga sp. BS]